MNRIVLRFMFSEIYRLLFLFRFWNENNPEKLDVGISCMNVNDIKNALAFHSVHRFWGILDIFSPAPPDTDYFCDSSREEG